MYVKEIFMKYLKINLEKEITAENWKNLILNNECEKLGTWNDKNISQRKTREK